MGALARGRVRLRATHHMILIIFCLAISAAPCPEGLNSCYCLAWGLVYFNLESVRSPKQAAKHSTQVSVFVSPTLNEPLVADVSHK